MSQSAFFWIFFLRNRLTGNVSGGIVQLWTETFPGTFPVTFPKETEMMFQTGDRRQDPFPEEAE
jgi:hypothetical protein